MSRLCNTITYKIQEEVFKVQGTKILSFPLFDIQHPNPKSLNINGREDSEGGLHMKI